jgi:hypothetical protein
VRSLFSPHPPDSLSRCEARARESHEIGIVWQFGIVSITTAFKLRLDQVTLSIDIGDMVRGQG